MGDIPDSLRCRQAVSCPVDAEPSAQRPAAGPHRPAPWQHPKPLVRPPLPSKAGAPSRRLDHYATLSGATGASLAGELRRQLAAGQDAGAPPSMAPAPVQRDLLGRKVRSLLA